MRVRDVRDKTKGEAPMETKSYAEHTLDEMRSDCNYDPERDGSVDDLIAYKDALEDKLCDVLAAFARIASRTGGSAADVAEEVYGELYGLGYRTELPDDQGAFVFPPPESRPNTLQESADALRAHMAERRRAES